jgi:hypothetical protein
VRISPLDRRIGPEPDVSVVRSEAEKGMEQTPCAAADVLLAVEVVSPDFEARDREAKPHKYATAGIPHFWLVEMTGTDQHPVVRVYELDPVTKAYTLTGSCRALRSRVRLQELQPVAGRVMGVEAAVAGKGPVPLHDGPVGLQAGRVLHDPRHAQARVGLLRGAEVLLDAQMELDRAGGEPAAAAGGEHRRFRDLGHAQGVGVEGAQGVLGAGWGGELYVVDGGETDRGGHHFSCGHHFSLRATAKTRRNGKTVPYGPGG